MQRINTWWIRSLALVFALTTLLFLIASASTANADVIVEGNVSQNTMTQDRDHLGMESQCDEMMSEMAGHMSTMGENMIGDLGDMDGR